MNDKEINKTTDPRDAALIWEPVSVEHIIQDKWIDFRKVAYRFPDGSTFSPYYNYSRRSYVVIVASDEKGKFLCVRQYRHGIGEVTTEFVAGGIECENGKDFYHSVAVLHSSSCEVRTESGDRTSASLPYRHLIIRKALSEPMLQQ